MMLVRKDVDHKDLGDLRRGGMGVSEVKDCVEGGWMVVRWIMQW